MTERKNQSSIEEILSQLQKDLHFKKMHQRRDKIDILSKFQNTYGQMIKLIRRMESKNSSKCSLDIESSLKTGNRIFLYYQHKIFTWISAWILSKHQIQIDQISNCDISILTTLFSTKDPTFLRYQFFLETSRASHIKTIWDDQHDEALLSIINREHSYSLKQLSSWKFFSFELFTKLGYPITPKECRDRWESHLNPNLNKQKWTIEQDRILLQLHQEYGTKWSIIAQKLQTRNQHMVKNRINSIKHKARKNHIRYKNANLLEKLNLQNTKEKVLLQPESNMLFFHKKAEQDQTQLLKMQDQSANIIYYDPMLNITVSPLTSEIKQEASEYSIKEEQND